MNKQVKNLVKKLKEVELFLQDNINDESTAEQISSVLNKALNFEEMKHVVYYTNNQINDFISLYENNCRTFTKKDEMLDCEDFVNKVKKINNIEQHIEFFENREKNGIKIKDLNKTTARYVSVNFVDNKLYVEIIPANFLESLMLCYIKYSMFVDDNNSNVKMKIRNILKNTSLEVDLSLYSSLYKDFEKLIQK